jgi:5-methylcytosine-specific restriction endonuclease McrA
MHATLQRRARGQDVPTLDELRRFFERQMQARPLCPYCRKGLSVKDVSLDHLVPLSRGGSTLLANTQFICKGCNKSKGDMAHDEYFALLGMLDAWEARARNFTLKAKVLTALRVASSFRIGANRRRKA